MKPGWSLGPEAWQRLLGALASDESEAAEIYLDLKRKLTRFFEWRGALRGDELADEVLDRVARRLELGGHTGNIPALAFGVARMVALEHRRSPERKADELDDGMPAAEPEREDRLRGCLSECLKCLLPAQREMLLEYYAEERSAKIERRKELAARLGLELNALRIRAHRLREKLESCTRRCVNGDSEKSEAGV